MPHEVMTYIKCGYTSYNVYVSECKRVLRLIICHVVFRPFAPTGLFSTPHDRYTRSASKFLEFESTITISFVEDLFDFHAKYILILLERNLSILIMLPRHVSKRTNGNGFRKTPTQTHNMIKESKWKGSPLLKFKEGRELIKHVERCGSIHIGCKG